MSTNINMTYLVYLVVDFPFFDKILAVKITKSDNFYQKVIKSWKYDIIVCKNIKLQIFTKNYFWEPTLLWIVCKGEIQDSCYPLLCDDYRLIGASSF